MKTKKILKELGINEEALAARGLKQFDEASELVIAEIDSDGFKFHLTPKAAKAWKDLSSKAQKDKIEIFIVSAFRSIDLQCKIIKKKIEAGNDISEILKVCAAPGYSQHHTGNAIDIGTQGFDNLEIDFETTKAFSWLEKYAEEYGFILSYPRDNDNGYLYEPWHWFYNIDHKKN